MVLQPGSIALTVGSTVTTGLTFAAAALGVRIMRRWDLRSSTEAQLLLERRTYLVSTLVQYALLFEIVSLFLFIYTADDLHNLLVGAMCATGVLNANAYGFPALYARILTLFIAGAWITLNHLDNRTADLPLMRIKYGLSFVLFPVVLAAAVLQTAFFASIDPAVITSCCGVLFSEEGAGLASSLAALPVRTTEAVFGVLFAAALASAAAAFRSGSRRYTVLLGILSLLFFFWSVVSIVTFISPYYYQLPTHHCPFDLLQGGYYYVGYPLYLSLFCGCFFGIMTGVAETFRRFPSLAVLLPRIQRLWAAVAGCCMTVFVILSTAPMLLTSFRLEGY